MDFPTPPRRRARFRHARIRHQAHFRRRALAALAVSAALVAGIVVLGVVPPAASPASAAASAPVASQAAAAERTDDAEALLGAPPAASEPARVLGAVGDLAAVDPDSRWLASLPDPKVVRFRPRDGWTDVVRTAQLSARFTAPMDPVSTEAAFSAQVVGGAPISGSIRWAEGGTVLVLDPTQPLPYGAKIQLSVASGARSITGTPVVAGASATFTVVAKPTTRSTGSGGGSAGAGWRWPLIGPITQYFGQRLTRYGFHLGIDIDGSTGDTIRAARGGRVIVAGWYDSCGGLQVQIDHGGGIVSIYHHMSRVAVKVGKVVAAGTVIGAVGSTGCAYGSHLHFAIRVGSTYVDPLRYLPRR